MPASRSAAAMTRAPRSCPSRPGLPTSTRIRPGLAAVGVRLAVSIPTSSELRRRLVRAELLFQDGRDLPDPPPRPHPPAPPPPHLPPPPPRPAPPPPPPPRR